MEEKRLFIALSIDIPWPSQLGEGRLLSEENRHITLSFLGNQNPEKISSIFDMIQPPSLGFAGICKEILFLPPKSPHLVAWKIDWMDEDKKINALLSRIDAILNEHKIVRKREKRDFLSHVTIARDPKNIEEWREKFSSLPLITPSLVLFESKGNSTYKKLAEKKLLLPFEEFSHTADLALYVRGFDYSQIHLHAQLALSFFFPPILDFLQPRIETESIDEIIISLNDMVTKADIVIGAPFKAVSFHGQVKQEKDHLVWEMIIDV